MESLKPLHGKVFIHNMEKGERVVRGIIIRDDNAKSRGVRPRWARVYAIGDGVVDLNVGDWVLMEHGRWSRSMDFNDDMANHSEEYVVHLADYPNGVLVVSDTKPENHFFGEDP